MPPHSGPLSHGRGGRVAARAGAGLAPRLSHCGRCGRDLPRTPEHFYFRPNGDRTGYCKPCQAEWWRSYWPTATDYQRERRRRTQRWWWREHRGRGVEASGG